MSPKGNRRGGPSEGTSNPPNPENPSQVPEGEPRVDLEEEEMDCATIRNLMATIPVEMNNMRANHETISQTVLLQQREIERQRQEMMNQ